MLTWHEMIENKSLLGRYVEWVDGITGEMFRAQIKDAKETKSGSEVELEFLWCARQRLHPNVEWRRHACSSLTIAKARCTTTQKEDGEIGFLEESYGYDGTIFPPKVRFERPTQ